MSAAKAAGAEVAPSMPEEFAAASVLVVPLWVGAGARVKVVEAMAARLPVVATPLACEASRSRRASTISTEPPPPTSGSRGRAALGRRPA